MCIIYILKIELSYDRRLSVGHMNAHVHVHVCSYMYLIHRSNTAGFWCLRLKHIDWKVKILYFVKYACTCTCMHSHEGHHCSVMSSSHTLLVLRLECWLSSKISESAYKAHRKTWSNIVWKNHIYTDTYGNCTSLYTSGMQAFNKSLSDMYLTANPKLELLEHLSRVHIAQSIDLQPNVYVCH